jgi:hypothetical protein
MKTYGGWRNNSIIPNTDLMGVSCQPHGCIRDWVRPTDGLEVMEERKISFPLSGIEPRLLGRPPRSLVGIPTELSRLAETQGWKWNLHSQSTYSV